MWLYGDVSSNNVDLLITYDSSFWPASVFGRRKRIDNQNRSMTLYLHDWTVSFYSSSWSISSAQSETGHFAPRTKSHGSLWIKPYNFILLHADQDIQREICSCCHRRAQMRCEDSRPSDRYKIPHRSLQWLINMGKKEKQKNGSDPPPVVGNALWKDLRDWVIRWLGDWDAAQRISSNARYLLCNRPSSYMDDSPYDCCILLLLIYRTALLVGCRAFMRVDRVGWLLGVSPGAIL